MIQQRVLLVDDDETNRFILSEMLDLLGYDVLEAVDGASAIQLACDKAASIGMILMDVHMPGLSGADATTRIRRLRSSPSSDTPILAVTADEAWVRAGAHGEAGFSGSIAKPVELEALKATLGNILR